VDAKPSTLRAEEQASPKRSRPRSKMLKTSDRAVLRPDTAGDADEMPTNNGEKSTKCFALRPQMIPHIAQITVLLSFTHEVRVSIKVVGPEPPDITCGSTQLNNYET
jgi:hypothetical protein